MLIVCNINMIWHLFFHYRLVKVYQFWAFMDRSERHTNYPNLLRFVINLYKHILCLLFDFFYRFVSLIHYLLLVFHWNACLFHLLFPEGFNGSSGGQTNNPSPWEHSNYPHLDEKGENDSFMTYLKSVYWTVLAMTTIGDIPWPKTQSEYLVHVAEDELLSYIECILVWCQIQCFFFSSLDL